jgi:hypothetical protein
VGTLQQRHRRRRRVANLATGLSLTQVADVLEVVGAIDSRP